MPRVHRIPNPKQRILRVYAFDPSRGARLENHLTVRVPYEKLKKGPVGSKVAVIDYDASNNCYYEAVDLDATGILGQNGLDPSEADPQFHQQMVYAVVMDTIRRFELALGRQIRWRPDHSPSNAPYHGLLRVYPHAMQEANAFYDPQRHALLFGYFRATEEEAGPNLPGQLVFTCLSHDIIVHETTHAILDGIREHFNDPTSLDAPAFHEGFADIVALLQHFSFKDSLLDTIQRTGGLIHRNQLAPDVNAELIDQKDPSAGSFTFRGGTTLIINRQGEVRFSISKSIHGKSSQERLARQRDYLQQMAGAFALAPYVAFDPQRELSFRGIHRGY